MTAFDFRRRAVQRISSGISTTTSGTGCGGPNDDPWEAAIREIGEHVNGLLRPEAEHEQSFCWRVLMTGFGRNRVRRLLLGAEMAVVYPRPLNLRYGRALVGESSLLAQGSDRRLEDYVSFTRADFHPVDKISCDWCAVSNGVLAWTGDLLDDALRGSGPLPAHWRFDGGHPFGRVFEALRWLPLSAVRRNYDRALVAAQTADIRQRAQRRLAGAELEGFVRAAGRFVSVRHIASCVEKRYCPFLHLRELAYAPDYCIYDWRVPEQVEAAARVLAERGAVDCHECAAVLAASPLVPADDTPSIMEDYFALLCRASTGGGPAPAAGAAAETVDACTG